jgi:O-antigen ligase
MKIATARIETTLIAAAGLAFLTLLVGALLVLRLDPLIVLAVCAGATVLVMLVLNPMVGFHVLVALFYFEYALVTKEGYTSMQALGPIILGAWIINLMVRRRNPLRFDLFMVILIAFILWGSMSLFYAENFDFALTKVMTYVQLATMCVMGTSLMSDTQKIASVFWEIVVWSAVAALYGLLKYAAGLALYVTGPGENRNQFAMLLTVSLVVCFVLSEHTRHIGLRTLLRFGFLPLFAIALALTLSRGGYVCLVAASLMLSYRLARTRRIWPVIVLLLTIVLVSPFLPEAFFLRVESIFPAVSEQGETFGERVNAWEHGIKMVKAHPFTGVGLGNFGTMLFDFSRGKELQRQIAPHSSYVGMAAETGLVGFALYFALVGVAIRSATHAFYVAGRLARSDLQVFAAAVEAGLVGVMVWSFSGNSETMKMLWLLFAAARSLRGIATRLEAEAARAGPPATAAA